MTAPLRIPLLLAAVSAVGCFDVSTDRPAPLLIDDFDSGSALPADRHFDQWRCGKYKPDMKEDCECGYDATTYHSYPYSMYLQATIVETGDLKEAGAQLYTQGYAPEDLSHFSEIVFDARYQASSPALPGDAPLYVELWCSSASGHVLEPVQNWQSATDWQTFAIELSQFTSPWGGGVTACLEQVYGIHFSVNGGLSRGKDGGFTLHIDDVYFR